MWSHTIKTSAPKSTNPPAERPARAGNNLKKKDEVVKTPEEDMTKGFDADGFSKTSKVHAYKKPLTVAKAPSFGRTTSRAGQTATSGTDSLGKDGQNKSTQPVRPTQTPKTSTPVRVPRTATPTQSSSRASKAGTPLKNKPPIISPKKNVASRRVTNTSTPNGIRSIGSEDSAPDLETQKPGEPGEISTNDDHSKHDNDFEDISRAKDIQDHQGLEELKDTIAVKDGEIRDLQNEIQRLQTTKDAEIQELQVQTKNMQITNENRDEETKAAFLAQIAPLESEIDDARKKISVLEAAHLRTQEESSKALGLKDEEIQKLSQAVHGRRRDQESKESALSLKDEFQRLQTQHKRELDAAIGESAAKLEAIQVERDELIQSRDKEIKEMSDLVQELQERVEKAHQADKDELREANRKHEQELHGKVEEHEQELQDATMRYEELREKASQLEQELRNIAAKHVKDMDDAEKERQILLRDATERHEQESRDTASKYQKEVEDLMLVHHNEIKTARTRNEQASEDSAAKHQQEIEVLTTKHKEELEAAAARQEQALEDAAANFQQMSQVLENKHLEELRTADNRDEVEAEALSAKHQQEVRDMTAKHQGELEEVMAKNKHDSGNAALQSQQAVETMIAKHREESANAASQIEELRALTEKHQQELGNVASTHEQDLERVTLKHQQELHGLTTGFDRELEDAKAKYGELENRSLKKEQDLREATEKHEEEVGRLQNQLETAAGNVASLETSLREFNLRTDDSNRDAALKLEQELQTATCKYEEELQSLRTIYATAVEEITALRRTLQDVEQKQREAVEEELQSLRTIYATAVEEITALRRKVEALDRKRNEAVDEAASLKASLDDLDLKRCEAVGQLTSLQGIMKDEELERSEAAVEIALLRDKLELADRRFEQDQQAVSDLQRQIRVLEAQIAELSTDKNLDQTEAAVDAALFKDKLELADLEIHLHKGTISALQNETERLQAQLAENSNDKNLDHNEAVVDVALLKDKLELADIQIRQAKGTVSNLQEEIEELKTQITDSTIGMDLDQNEAAVEIALLKNTLELANLESHQDKATITTLRKQNDGLQTQIASAPKTGSYTHHQLRDELSMLERHHDAQVTDLDALRADMAADSQQREQEWKKRADVWDKFASELQGMKTFVGTVGGRSRANSID